MRFDEKEHKVIIDSMTQSEAEVFVIFLETEIIRHREDIVNAQELINQVILRFGEVK